MILANLSASLLHMGVNSSEEIVTAAQAIVEGVSIVLEYASIVGIGSSGRYSLFPQEDR